MSEKQQRLVYAILDFLKQSIVDCTVKVDDKESLEIAIQCIGEAFGVDPSNQEQVAKLTVKPATLQNIFDVFINTKDRIGTNVQASTSGEPLQSSPSADDKAQADQLKQTGNSFMTNKKYDDAIDAYTKAIALDPGNAVYYSNRAAAQTSKGDHLAAVSDAELALAADPNFVKAYHRLGHAQYSLGDFTAAAETFERGLKLDPSNASLKSGLQNSQARIASDDLAGIASRGTEPNPGADAGLGGMADMLRNLGGGGGAGGGGMPDFANLLNNPGVTQMVQQLLNNGGLSNFMQNPAVADMMNRVQQGDMPSMEEIMRNPALRNLAGQLSTDQR